MRPRLALAVAALLPACAAPEVGAGVPGGAVAVEPSLGSIQANVLTPRCLGSACHEGTGGVPVNLTPEGAFAGMVGAASTQADGLPVVAPGEPERSYLMQKLHGTHAAAGSGAIMPPDGDPLPDDALQAIATWIANGALDD